MLKETAPSSSPDLKKTFAKVGQGNESVLAEAHFPGQSRNSGGACALTA
jgi:L-fucose mutarotase/ribose pyranase (RbsD/FucU family)